LVGYAEVSLAGLYEDQVRYDDAQRLAQDALSIFRSALPPDHPKTSEALNLLAILHMMRREFADGVELAREVAGRFARTLGEDHPDTLTAKNNLAFGLLHVGRAGEAEAILRDVLAHRHADNGQGEAIDNENLAQALYEQGRYAEAVNCDRRALEIERQREGADSARAAVALRSLAVPEELSGDNAAAERDLRAALKI